MIRKILCAVLIFTILTGIFAPVAMAISPKEQEDIFRANSFFDDPVKQNYYEALKDNSYWAYHLTANDMGLLNRAVANWNNYEEVSGILGLFLTDAFNETKNESLVNSYGTALDSFFNGFKKFLSDAKFVPAKLKEYNKAVNAVQKEYLQDIGASELVQRYSGKLDYQDILNDILANCSTSHRSDLEKSFETFKKSSAWIRGLTKFSEWWASYLIWFR